MYSTVCASEMTKGKSNQVADIVQVYLTIVTSEALQ